MAAVPNASSVSWRHSLNATKSQPKKIPQEPERVGVQEGSLIDNTVTGPGPGGAQL